MAILFPSYILDWTSRIYLALLPSYLRAQAVKTDKPPKPVYRTAYLDGLRGVASFLVFFRHFLLPWLPNLDHGFGQGPENNNFLQLPIIRLMYSGPNVPLFLVVSGYVMALKPLSLMRKGDVQSLGNSLASSVFRRGMRIFAPPVISTFIVMLLAQAGLFGYPYASLPGHIPSHPSILLDWSQQFTKWFQFIFEELTNPFTWSTHSPLTYGAHLWTIPLQFRCSMVLFITIMGLSNLRTQCRLVALLLLISFSLFHKQWPVALYLGGMGIAEYDLIRLEQKGSLPPIGSVSVRENLLMRYLRKLTPYLIAGLGLYLSSFPRSSSESTALGYYWITLWEPYYGFWHALGAILLVRSLGEFKHAQWIFTTRLARYLGRLSFSLYIVHEPFIHVVVLRTVALSWRLTGNDTSMQFYSGLALSFLVTTPMLLWVVELFYYWIDEPCGRLTQWVEKRCRLK